MYYDEGNDVRQTTDGGYIIAGFGNFFGADTGDVYLIKTDTQGNLQWERFFAWDRSDAGMAVWQTADNGYIIAGGTTTDVYLIKTDAGGYIQWQTTFGDAGSEIGQSVQQTLDGGYIIAGWTTSFGAGSSDVYLIKTDANGIFQWQNTFGGANNDYGRHVQQTTDGGYITVGETSSFGAGGSDIYLIKANNRGQ